MITYDMVVSGYNSGLIKLINASPFFGDGIACSIGDNWFYFGGHTAEEYSDVAEYKKDIPKTDIIKSIFEVLEQFLTEYVEEYRYYESFLRENGIKEKGVTNEVSGLDKIKIDLGFATLVAEKGSDPNYNEVFVGLEDKDGVWIQDLAIVRQKYHYEKALKAANIKWDVDYDEDGKLLPTEIDVPVGMVNEDDITDYLSDVTGFCHDGYDLVGMDNSNVVQEKVAQVLVFGDKDNENFTHEFSIDIYEEEKELPPLDFQINAAEKKTNNKGGFNENSIEFEEII